MSGQNLHPYLSAAVEILNTPGGPSRSAVETARNCLTAWLSAESRTCARCGGTRVAAPTRVWVIPSRVGMWRGDEEEAHDGGTVSYCWCVWDLQAPAQPGRSDLRWLPITRGPSTS